MSYNLFDIFGVIVYPTTIPDAEICLITGDAGSFNFADKTKCFVPGDKHSVLIDLNGKETERIFIDFDKGTARYIIDGREYVFVNKTTSSTSRKISPAVWKDNESRNSKLYTAVPLSQNEELIIYSDISDIIDDPEEIETISSYFDDITAKISLADNINITLNGFDINEGNVNYISSTAITLKDNSFLSSSLFSESQRANLKAIYSEKVFKSWSGSSKLPVDSEGRKVYVRVIDGVRYTFFVKDENFESAVNTFDFKVSDTVSEVDKKVS